VAGFEGKRSKYRTDLGKAAMARLRPYKKTTRSAHARKKPEDATVKMPVAFEDAVKALLGTKPPKK
jgi:hypothetical protein